jgi:TDG/mug DNA glycosylase family protein
MIETAMAQPIEGDPKTCLGLVANDRTRILLLGTLPGSVSLARREYYANPSNQFWRLIGLVVGQDLVETAYNARLAALLEAGMGLWDVIASATRAGSLDSAIRECSTNSLETIVTDLPLLKALAFNGGRAFQIGRRLSGHDDLALLPLPSSSAAYCAMPFEKKLEKWLQLAQFLPRCQR